MSTQIVSSVVSPSLSAAVVSRRGDRTLLDDEPVNDGVFDDVVAVVADVVAATVTIVASLFVIVVVVVAVDTVVVVDDCDGVVAIDKLELKDDVDETDVSASTGGKMSSDLRDTNDGDPIECQNTNTSFFPPCYSQ